MRCLWLTWIDPAPGRDGQRIYSGHLIAAVAAAGADVEVLCAGHAASSRLDGSREGRVCWWLTAAEMNPTWASTLSSLPHIAHRSATAGMRRRLLELLRRQRWDCVVVDGLYPGWALDVLEAVFKGRPSRPKLVYLSHNHEASTRARVAAGYDGGMLKGMLLRHDARKAGRLERRLVDAADLVTAITPDDEAQFRASPCRAPTLVLTPGYEGRRLGARVITAAVPRRAVIVGSFDWLAKQINLRDFLAVADPLFAEAGAELQVVGSGDERFLGEMRQRLKAATVVGPVPSVERYFDDSRIAIVAERIGGGFKLKVLDYVFNRLPIATLEGAVAGVPLRPDDAILTFDSFEKLAQGVLSVLDDFPLLNRVQEQAYRACRGRFDWQVRGEQLVAAIGGA